MSIHPNEALSRFGKNLGDRIALTIKSLLETKHLYQSATVEVSDLVAAACKPMTNEFKNYVEQNCKAMLAWPWKVEDSAGFATLIANASKIDHISFEAPDAKLFCSGCDRIEAFNPVSAESFFERVSGYSNLSKNGSRVQVYVLSLLCQSCKKSQTFSCCEEMAISCPSSEGRR